MFEVLFGMSICAHLPPGSLGEHFAKVAQFEYRLRGGYQPDGPRLLTRTSSFSAGGGSNSLETRQQVCLFPISVSFFLSTASHGLCRTVVLAD